MKLERWTLLVSAATMLLAGAAAAQPVTLKPVPSGAARMIGGYIPQKLELSATKPAALKKAPTDLKAPMYGTLDMGAKSFVVIVDRPEGADSKLYVDTNGNGDLTDDPSNAWTKAPYKSRDGKDLTRWTGSTRVQIDLGQAEVPASLLVYIFDRNDPDRAALKDTLLYYNDYALQGEVQIGSQTYKAILTEAAIGDFRGKEGKIPYARLLLDRNGDGKYDSQSEWFDVRKPFNIGGVTYEIQGMTANGGKFEIARSTQNVVEIPLPPDLTVGKKTLAFDATTTDGKAVQFPSSYKGKVVMLDFWATWCGPCIGELPNVTAAYKKYHPKGFEILGISLDQPNMAEKLAAFTKEHEMPWAQIYEGKSWEVSLVKMHGVHAIPFALLVDGDTGEILASGNSLRGQGLLDAVEKALAKKATTATRASR